MAYRSYNNGEVVTREVDRTKVVGMVDGPRKKFLLMSWIGDNYQSLGLEAPTSRNIKMMSCVEIVEFIRTLTERENHDRYEQKTTD